MNTSHNVTTLQQYFRILQALVVSTQISPEQEPNMQDLQEYGGRIWRKKMFCFSFYNASVQCKGALIESPYFWESRVPKKNKRLKINYRLSK